MGLFVDLIVCCVAINCIFAAEKPCCTSKRFFGVEKVTTGTVSNGNPVATQNTFFVDYNRDMRMERAVGSFYNDTDRTTTPYTIYNDYRHGKRYGFYGMGSTTCVVTPIDPDSQPGSCVPSELSYEATLIVGSGNETVNVNVWSGFLYNMQWRMETTVNDCTPVSLVRYGMGFDGLLTIESTTYSNITQYRQSSDDVFVIPDQCRNVDIPVGK